MPNTYKTIAVVTLRFLPQKVEKKLDEADMQ